MLGGTDEAMNARSIAAAYDGGGGLKKMVVGIDTLDSSLRI